MIAVKAVYVDEIEVQHPELGATTLHVWMNPETKQLAAIDNMELLTTENSIVDPYDNDFRLVFEDTFTGLPK